ncbi:MAG TPA: M48 family metallopeptidase [Bacillota bacterium]
MSKSGRITFFILVIAITTACFWMAPVSAESFLVKVEKEIGFSSYQQMVREKRVVNLPPAQANSINNLFKRLVQCSSRNNEIQYSLTVLEDPEVNAFALPGGYIFVNTELLDCVASEGELAGVLGHEIAHVDRKHGINAVIRAVGFTIALSIVANKYDDSDRLAQIGAVALGLAQKGYSRSAEFEADRYAVQFMTAVGYSKVDFVNFLRKLEQKYGSGSDFPILQLVSTHPPTSERIKQIESM